MYIYKNKQQQPKTNFNLLLCSLVLFTENEKPSALWQEWVLTFLFARLVK